MLIVQCCIVLLMVFHKIFLILNKSRIAWLYGLGSMLLSGYYLYILHYNIYPIFMGFMIFSFLYGVFPTEEWIDTTAYICMFCLIICVAPNLVSNYGVSSVTELISSIAFLLGVWGLIHNHLVFGWICTTIAHGTLAYFMKQSNQDIMFTAQIILGLGSIYILFYVYVDGIFPMKYTRKRCAGCGAIYSSATEPDLERCNECGTRLELLS